MSVFDRRWRILARAASRAGEAPIPHPPDGASLKRRAAARGEPAAPPWPYAWRTGLAIALLWTVAVPMAPSAWRGVRDVLARLAESAPLSAPPLALPQSPTLPDVLPRLRWADPPAEAPPKETPS